jgi:ABC-type glucose/galactose transport system permease subunit
MDQKAKLKEMAAKTKVFATQLQSMPEFVAVFKALTNLRLLMCMLVAWIMGIGMGLIFTFLFWHLQVKITNGWKQNLEGF